LPEKKSSPQSRPQPAQRKSDRTAPHGFPIVGIGASAGGLEALEGLFRAVPDGSGMAFVLVQHLDPAHASMLTSILQRCTSMHVVEVTDNLRVAPEVVYVIPPNRDMVIYNGCLQLSVPEQPYGHRLPIDSFLRSLAEDQAERAIGIILSGTGTDGTLGLRTILGAGGLTIVQDPATAKYDGMPTGAIRAGCASLVLPVEKMPEALLNGKRALSMPKVDAGPSGQTSSLNRILQVLHSGTGNDFSKYKRSTIGRRIERRMALQNIEEMEVYARFLKENPGEVQLLFKELLINVTSFFRDPEVFITLRKDVLPKLVAGKGPGETMRVWVAGCATGEEAYSIAMLLREIMEENQRPFKVQIYATDLDHEAIAAARIGKFPVNISQDVPQERLHNFFVKQENGYQVRKEVREMVVFATQNVIKDPPFTRMDLISCRNLLIYLEPELQDHILGIFRYSLNAGGILLLSPSESIGGSVELFRPLHPKGKIFKAVPTAGVLHPLLAGNAPIAKQNETREPQGLVSKVKESDLSSLMKQELIACFAPASVLTDLKANILFVHGETGKYFQPAPGRATFNAIEMAREGLKTDLRLAVQRAAADGAPTLNKKLSVKTNGDFQAIGLSVRLMQLKTPGEGLLLLSFQELARTAPRRRGKRIAGEADPVQVEELERELADTKENLQAIIEEQQASNEELKSTNEELQSTNEELQSTNEELETSKEELQSVNEELITVNAELQAKIEQLNDMQNDMKNLLDSTSIGTIFLDEHLAIRRFTQEAVKVFRLVATDTGRPLADIKSDLVGEDLLVRARNVLETLAPFECEVHTAGGVSYLARIRPYRTFDNVIEGVVLTFTDISGRIKLEAVVNEARRVAEAIVDTVRDPLLVLDADLRVVSASRSFYQSFKIHSEDAIGRPIGQIPSLQWNLPQLRDLLEGVLSRNVSLEGYAVVHDLPGVGHKTMHLNARRINREDETAHLLLVAFEAAEEAR
jgi:two-component system CheB/CheR fusion protein